jgi:hypothetical protein
MKSSLKKKIFAVCILHPLDDTAIKSRLTFMLLIPGNDVKSIWSLDFMAVTSLSTRVCLDKKVASTITVASTKNVTLVEIKKVKTSY